MILKNDIKSNLRLSIPSDGALYGPTMEFLSACGLKVERTNERQYIAKLIEPCEATVIFQRATDITRGIENGTSDLGITGFDKYLENKSLDIPTIPLIQSLNYGKCSLVLAVPIGWIETDNLSDLREISIQLAKKNKTLRIATKYERLVENYLRQNKIINFTLIQSSGGLEGAPSAGYADMIADIRSSGTTLTQNNLKELSDGTILSSEACIVANTLTINDPSKLAATKIILELLEAYLSGIKYYHLTANINGKNETEITNKLSAKSELMGIRGPSLSTVYTSTNANLFSITLIIKHEAVLETVDHIRKCGGMDIACSQIDYLFENKSKSYATLIKELNKK